MAGEISGVVAVSPSSKGSVSWDTDIGEMGAGTVGNAGVVVGSMVLSASTSDGESLGRLVRDMIL